MKLRINQIWYRIGITIYCLFLFPSLILSAETSVKLTWNSNSEPNLLGYYLHYKSQGTGPPYDGQGLDQGPSPISVPASSSPAITLTGLEPNLYYEFVVTAYNSYGESVRSEPVRAFALTVHSGANGQVACPDPMWIAGGETHAVTILPDEGFFISDVMVNGASVGPVSSYLFHNVTENQTLNAFFSDTPTDTDHDGLFDHEEINIYGTNRHVADSDGDGINDGEELRFWGNEWNRDIDGDSLFNLLDADSDNDGILDGEEIRASSDPSKPPQEIGTGKREPMRAVTHIIIPILLSNSQ